MKSAKGILAGVVYCRGYGTRQMDLDRSREKKCLEIKCHREGGGGGKSPFKRRNARRGYQVGFKIQTAEGHSQTGRTYSGKKKDVHQALRGGRRGDNFSAKLREGGEIFPKKWGNEERNENDRAIDRVQSTHTLPRISTDQRRLNKGRRNKIPQSTISTQNQQTTVGT